MSGLSREKPNYRFILADIDERTGGKRILSVSDVAKYTGKSRDWCKLHIPFNSDNEIHAVALARHFA